MKDKALTKVKNLGLGIGDWGLEVGGWGLEVEAWGCGFSKILPAPINRPKTPSTTPNRPYIFQPALPDAQNPGFPLSCRIH